MTRISLRRLSARATAAATIIFSLQALALQLPATAVHAQDSAPLAPTITGPPGYAMAEPVAGQPVTTNPLSSSAKINASYTHTPAANSSNDLPAGSGPVMTSTTIYYDFWLPTGQHYESTSAGDTNYESLLIRWANDLGGSQYHNLVTQYNGTNGTISNTVTFGGSSVDSTTAYPHAGTTADPLQDSDIQTEVKNAVATNGWTEDVNHIVAVFTATGIQECNGSNCTFQGTNPFCAYHDHFSDGSNDSLYAFMGFDNFTHQAGKTCVAGQTSGDTDPNRGVYPNGDVSADAEVNTLSHEIIEAETDPHPNATWTGPNGEIGDACNFTFTPRNSSGADVFINGNPYVVQEEYSNAVHTCAIDLPTNGFCSGSVSSVCSPSVTFTKSVDNSTPKVTRPINYTITLDNTNDTGAATNLSVTDTVPAGYTITNVSAPGSTTSSNDTTSLTIDYDTLPVHQTQTITVTATVPVQPGVVATNCGSLALQDLLQNALSALTTSPCATTTPVKVPTTVTFLGAFKSDFNDTVTVMADLKDDMGAGINGETVTFTLNGSETCMGGTDPTGRAFCPITPGETAGPYTITASFAGDSVYDPSSTSAVFTVLLEESAITSSPSQQLIQQGGTATLTAVLTDPDGGAPIAGKPVTITLGSGAGSQSCPATTDLSGTATCSISPVTVAQGPQSITDSFAGDTFYVAASNTQSALIYAFPPGGDFAVGDKTATGTVTFWGAQWFFANTLSGGIPPSAFKGFENSTPVPACGATIWTTSGGASPPPPATIPTYMGVIVTSNVAKSGRTISGNIVHIVVVKTDPGYAPDAGSTGTGTMVATVC
jgi:uncharacterized repeat protein (TIGR01451 family)